MEKKFSGHLTKMQADLPQPYGQAVQYSLPLGDLSIPLNPLVGQAICITFTGGIRCINCGRSSKKSFNQGYCYPCLRKLARCDVCIVSPEKCHYEQGTCREPEWADQHCMTDHIVYLANSSGVKVGITRANQIPVRWIDQGAIQALPIMRVATRYQSGLVEEILRQHVGDRTNWRAMLKGNPEPVDLETVRAELFERSAKELRALEKFFGLHAIRQLDGSEATDIYYPITEFPTKISSFNLDKNPLVEGTLTGIKGQYLILDTGVINIRKFTAYNVDFKY
jgi:hypothetical protein